MVALNKLSLAICLVFGGCILLMGAHIDSLAKNNFYLRQENKSLMFHDSLGRVELVKLTLRNRDLDMDNYLLKNEIYKLKNK
jgi:hypothetical protein